MKTLLAITTLLSFSAFGQYNTTLVDHNNAAATVSDAGILFNDFNTSSIGYEVPKGSGRHILYSALPAFAGRDINNQVHMAIGSNPAFGRDLFRGPIGYQSAYTDSTYMAKWDTAYFSFCQDEIDAYRKWWECSVGILSGNDCIGVQQPSADFLYRLYNYPAHGNFNNGTAYWIAPFYDYDQDGQYDPNQGDYPLIERGCCMTYIIMNDMAGPHIYSNSDPLGIEVHLIAYQYDVWGGYLDDVTFIEMKAINKSTATYFDFHSSLFVDPDLGNYYDDYFGSDSTLNMGYWYNADNNDEDNGGNLGYGMNPPAAGIVSLDNDLSSVISPYPSGGFLPVELYNAMSGLEYNGSAVLDENNQPTKFQYHDDPNDPNGWSLYAFGAIGSDTRFTMSVNQPVFAPGDTASNTFAVIFAQGSDHLNSVTNLLAMAADVKAFYDDPISLQSCEGGTWGLNEDDITDPELKVYPNPSKGWVTIELPERLAVNEIVIHDIFGREVYRTADYNQNKHLVNLNEAPGVYILQIVTSTGQFTQRIVIE